MLITNGSKII